MNKLSKRMILFISAAIIIVSVIAAGVFTALADIKTTTGYRYPSKYSSTFSSYSALRKVSDSTFAIPGLEGTNVLGEMCDCMTPQGICVMNDYILITAYCGVEDYLDDLSKHITNGDNGSVYASEVRHIRHNSVIYVLNKSNKSYRPRRVRNQSNANSFQGKCRLARRRFV